MPPFEQIPKNGEIESTEIDNGLEDNRQGAANESTPTVRQITFSLSHKYPELHTVMKNAEFLNYNNEMTADAIDASFLRAQQEYVSHFAPQINSLPDDEKDALLKSLNLDSKYQPNFPLYAQMLKC